MILKIQNQKSGAKITLSFTELGLNPASCVAHNNPGTLLSLTGKTFERLRQVTFYLQI